jgi:hypothetical protein
MKSYQVFISHAAEDAEFAAPIRQQLEAHGVRVFDPQVHLVPGMEFQSAIERALDEVSVLLVIFSPNAERSRWSEYEYRAFQEKMFSEEGGRQNALIPIIAGDSSPTSLPRALRRFRSIRADATEEIVEATLRHLADGSEMPPTPADLSKMPSTRAAQWSQKEWLWRFFFLLIGILVGFFILGR